MQRNTPGTSSAAEAEKRGNAGGRSLEHRRTGPQLAYWDLHHRCCLLLHSCPQSASLHSHPPLAPLIVSLSRLKHHSHSSARSQRTTVVASAAMQRFAASVPLYTAAVRACSSPPTAHLPAAQSTRHLLTAARRSTSLTQCTSLASPPRRSFATEADKPSVDGQPHAPPLVLRSGRMQH